MIISFYSYKGGSGRTQLVANIAAFLCFQQEKKVLLIDWDLEAPGLHFYFEKGDLGEKGLMDMFYEFERIMLNESEVNEAHLPNFGSGYITRLVSNNLSFIDLVPSGNYGSNLIKYHEQLEKFNWRKFYEDLDGKTYIEYLKKWLLNSKYDYILIDSRTGISDYSGICNVQLPSVNVIVVAPTNQNFIGAKRISDNILNSNYVKAGLRKARILPVLSRIDLSLERGEPREWISRFQNFFRQYLEYFSQQNGMSLEDFVNSTVLEYKRDVSYGEQVLFSDSIFEIESRSLAKQFSNIGLTIMRINQDDHKQAEETTSKQNSILDTSRFNDSAHNFVLIFGDVGSGKSTVLASLISYLYRNFHLTINPVSNKLGVSHMYELLKQVDNGKFPSVTPVGRIFEVDAYVGDSDGQKYTFVEMSGEDLSFVNPINVPFTQLEKEYASFSQKYIDELLRSRGSNAIIISLIDSTRVEESTRLNYLFFNYLKSMYDFDMSNLLLLISKWDLVEQKLSLRQFFDLNLTQLGRWFQNSIDSKENIKVFSVGTVDTKFEHGAPEIIELDYSYTRELFDWLRLRAVSDSDINPSSGKRSRSIQWSQIQRLWNRLVGRIN